MEGIAIVGILACGLGMLVMMAVMGWMMGKGMKHGSKAEESRVTDHGGEEEPRRTSRSDERKDSLNPAA
jgi:hypothetical protein